MRDNAKPYKEMLEDRVNAIADAHAKLAKLIERRPEQLTPDIAAKVTGFLDATLLATKQRINIAQQFNVASGFSLNAPVIAAPVPSVPQRGERIAGERLAGQRASMQPVDDDTVDFIDED